MSVSKELLKTKIFYFWNNILLFYVYSEREQSDMASVRVFQILFQLLALLAKALHRPCM